MGLFSVSVTADGAGGIVSGSRDLDPGILNSVSAYVPNQLVDKGEILIIARLHRGDPSEALAGAELIHDYVYGFYSPTWTGFIYLEPADRLIFSIISHTVERVVLTGLTSRLQQATLGGRLVDPRPL